MDYLRRGHSHPSIITVFLFLFLSVSVYLLDALIVVYRLFLLYFFVFSIFFLRLVSIPPFYLSLFLNSFCFYLFLTVFICVSIFILILAFYHLSLSLSLTPFHILFLYFIFSCLLLSLSLSAPKFLSIYLSSLFLPPASGLPPPSLSHFFPRFLYKFSPL